MTLYTIREAGLGMTLEEIVLRVGSPVRENQLPGQTMNIHNNRPRVWNFEREQLRIQFSLEGSASDISGDIFEISGNKVAEFGSLRSAVHDILGSPRESSSYKRRITDVYGENPILEIHYYRDRVRLFRLLSNPRDDAHNELYPPEGALSIE